LFYGIIAGGAVLLRFDQPINHLYEGLTRSFQLR